MYKHVAEYEASLAILGGNRWMEGESARHIFTAEDLRIMQAVCKGTVRNDATLAQFIYGKGAVVDARYRKRVTRLTNRLSRVALDCTLSSTINERRRVVITCVRHMATGDTLMRTAGPNIARHHLLEAVQRMYYPELVWYEPAVHFSLAYNDAVNGRGPAMHRSLALARSACVQANTVGSLQDLWIQLTLRAKSARAKNKIDVLVAKSRTLLSSVARSEMQWVVAFMAARLASSVALASGDIRLGLRWIERSKRAAQQAGRFNNAATREYHTQRMFLYNRLHYYKKALAEAHHVVELSPETSTYWFTGMSNMLHLQLKNGRYDEARMTSDAVMSAPALQKQPSLLVGRIRLRSLYARVLGNDKKVSLRTLKVAEKYVLDSRFLRILVALNRNDTAIAIDAMHSVKRHVHRSKVLRRDRSLQILVRLLATLANAGLKLDKCRKRTAFCKYEAELSTYKTMATDETVISPLSIWKDVVARA